MSEKLKPCVFNNCKGNAILETSVGIRSWSRSSTVSSQVTEAINPAVGCHFFPQARDYLPSRRASPPIGWYQIILLGDGGTRV